MTAKTLRKAAVSIRKSTMNTDDALAYYHMSREFAAHGVVNHSDGELSAGTAPFYVDEFAFRWDTRASLGIEDAERVRLMVKGAIGKRLTYRQPDTRKEV